ncbi:MAG: serine hydrolase domain-containing protein [Algiphilus sp.]
MADFVATTETDTVVFVHNGALVDEIYNNGYQEYTRQQPRSVTKTFIAATVGIADGEGRIGSLQDPIERYIPKLTGTPWEGVSIEDILQMESGVHWDEDTPVLAMNTQVQQWVQVLLDYYTYGAVGQTRNEFIKALPPAYEAGTEFRYNSGNTQVLAWMLSKIYQKPFNEIISEKLWIPMGAYGDARMIADREGATIASQGLYARAHDFARFGELMRRGGVNTRGEQVVPAAWIDRMTRMTKVSEGRYGYQTWNSDVSPGAYKASGFQGQKITVVPENCLTAVRLSHSFGLQYRDGEISDPDAYGFGTNFSADEWVAMVKAVTESLGGCDGTSPSRSATTLESGGGNGSAVAAGEASGGSGALSPLALLLLAAFAATLRAISIRR